jgi:hypothetical protein
MAEKEAEDDKYDDNILMPIDWKDLPLQPILKKLQLIQIEKKRAVPTCYSKRVREWNTFEIIQKNKMIHAWNHISDAEKRVILDEANRRKVFTVVSNSSNWNENDSARLIHLYREVKLISSWTQINTVIF